MVTTATYSRTATGSELGLLLDGTQTTKYTYTDSTKLVTLAARASNIELTLEAFRQGLDCIRKWKTLSTFVETKTYDTTSIDLDIDSTKCTCKMRVGNKTIIDAECSKSTGKVMFKARQEAIINWDTFLLYEKTQERFYREWCKLLTN